jgi:hypothetical protein
MREDQVDCANNEEDGNHSQSDNRKLSVESDNDEARDHSHGHAGRVGGEKDVFNESIH